MGFSTKVLAYQNKILKQEKKFPLDYIMKIPEAIESISLEMALRENKLKNVAMRVIIDIRERRRKPKLRDFIQKYKEKLAETPDKRGAKEEFQRKFKLLYGGGSDENTEDVKFNKLMSNFDRVQKALSHQQQAISAIVKRVNGLTERREAKEKKLRDRKKAEI